MYTPIRDYGIIGNLRSIALVSINGSIDWAPAPFLDSPSVFSRILDHEKGGHWSIEPVASFTSTQEYNDDSNILVTTFTTKEGIVKIIDFIPIERGESFSSEETEVTYKIHRKVACTFGKCLLRVVFNPKFNYASQETKLETIQGGIFAKGGKKEAMLSSNQKFNIDERGAVSEFELEVGQSSFFVFRHNIGQVEKDHETVEHHESELSRTKIFWEHWAHTCQGQNCYLPNAWHDEVVRSSLILKILFFDPTGTVAAAATTSLPEDIGGERNWDYRYTWIRDSAFVMQAFFQIKHVEEARRYSDWIIGQCRLHGDDPEHLQIMYGIRGQTDLTEQTLDHLDGYKSSKPVRVGNSAYKQHQWDIYGSIINLVWQAQEIDLEYKITPETWKTLKAIAAHVVKIWREPDEGLWEVRSGKRHFVYSKFMCWVAFDRMIKIMDKNGFDGSREIWEKEKNEIKQIIMERGWNEEKQSFVQAFDFDDLDASILQFPVYGFIDAKDPKMISTINRIKHELSMNDFLIRRYAVDDGLPGHEGAFLLASFWLVDALILSGDVTEATRIFKKITAEANHLGLFSEEINPRTGEFLGNFPQAYTHIGLINSAFLLEEALMKKSK